MESSNKSDNKPKVVATIDVNITMPKVEKRAWLDESLHDHFQCVLCGGALNFKHKTDFITQVVAEEAHCPHCGVRNRQATYSLQ